MKSLILVRHGKSSWEYRGVSDKDRPLLQRGINDAHLVASTYKKEKITIDAVFSSPANRALHTSMIFMRVLDLSFNKFRVTSALYDFSGNEVYQFVKELSDAADTVLIFGHNHAYTDVANTWGNEYIENVPTSGLVHLEFPVDSWKDVAKGKTKQILVPKQLR